MVDGKCKLDKIIFVCGVFSNVSRYCYHSESTLIISALIQLDCFGRKLYKDVSLLYFVEWLIRNLLCTYYLSMGIFCLIFQFSMKKAYNSKFFVLQGCSVMNAELFWLSSNLILQYFHHVPMKKRKFFLTPHEYFGMPVTIKFT